MEVVFFVVVIFCVLWWDFCGSLYENISFVVFFMFIDCDFMFDLVLFWDFSGSFQDCFDSKGVDYFYSIDSKGLMFFYNCEVFSMYSMYFGECVGGIFIWF